MVKHNIIFNTTKITKILFRQAKETNLHWFDAKPKETMLFGLITISKGNKAGWAILDWETESHWWSGNDPRDIDTNKEMVIIYDGKEVLYERPYVLITLIDGSTVKRYFPDNDLARNWVDEIVKRNGYNEYKEFEE